uniref:CSN8/PSMD8/EIF3K domain-containing protein n=1 Tax=Helicotheca tamesis TaxID=374047 RepID=A0A7S2MTK9_9STRA|mmetsp:Transcript_3089/g.4177  ORF Transcript_3089/g.4177 Transcript_3089/m.4177 type:complete len:259 (+) Transcript_3089:92-868(+)|eukprot:CAMPEP_0185727840 /NCGR_PEP_ID=MMETSP1171-20130828/3411_1 /TAXON_ID=374046 /ORGANISM="Helicotheca tamensis, Strain CCMP826" /LENGTH=258 /DNA_ID=CAMNT_0028396477 /DNA_START=47 /DNA_END=823 /DNA_ORIENTATION=+
MANVSSAKALLEELNQNAQAGNTDGGKVALAKLKIMMLEFPTGAAATPEHLSIAAQALELGILISVADEDLAAFARNVSQIKPYYAAATTSSPRKCHILGLNLMHLLVDNRLSEFHAELELLTEQEASTPFVSFPINLERQLMVGSYDEVLTAGSHVPDPSYTFFIDNLLQTVRDSIAECVEVSYKAMKIQDAMTMMKFESTNQLLEYIENNREDWIVEGGDTLCFQPPVVGGKASDIPSMDLISQSLSYATELERIV